MNRQHKALGKRIRQLREDADVTRATVADKAKITLGGISQIELGLVSPRLDTLRRLAKAIGCELSDFFATENRST